MGDVQRVLLVEDDVVDQMNVRRGLAKHGEVELVTARHGEDALELLRNELPLEGLLVLLDLSMPGMGGLSTLEALRADERLRHLPVVVLTTSDEERDRREAYRLNAAGYIVKPGSAETFDVAMEQLAHYWSINRLP